MPVSVVLFTLAGLAVGESRWNVFAAARLVTSLMSVVVLVALAVAGALTRRVSRCGLPSQRPVRQLSANRDYARCSTADVQPAEFLRPQRDLERGPGSVRSVESPTAGSTKSSWLRSCPHANSGSTPLRSRSPRSLRVSSKASARRCPPSRSWQPRLAARACRVAVLIVSIAAIIVAVVTHR